MTTTSLETVAKSLKELSFPTRFAVELCADCNLQCSMCHHDKMVRPKGVMPFELWKRCADEIAEVSPKCEVWFSFCGEPLLEPELLLRMIRYGREAGLQSISINTNGMYLTEDLEDRLLDSGVVRIVFGVDGLTKETYEKIRIGGERNQLYRTIQSLLAKKALRGSGPEIIVQFIEMNENQHEMKDFQKFWLDKDATVKTRKMLSWGGKFDTPLDVAPEDRIPCPWALTMMHVMWDGRVARCPGDTEAEEGSGNAWHESLTKLWAGLSPYRRHHLSYDFDALPERCQTCTDWMVGVARRERPDGEVWTQLDHEL